MRRPDSLTRLLLCFGALLFALPAPAADQLPVDVKQALTTARLPRNSYAFVVAPVDGGAPVLSVNADLPMNPASVMKIVTTGAALEILGPAHTWQTEVLVEPATASAPPAKDGVLAGPLFLRGNGDPRLNLEAFWMLLRELKLRGVREIRGDLVLDRSAFALPPHDPAAFDEEPLRPYNIGADPLLVNYGSLRFLLVPDEARKKVVVLQESPDPRIDVANRLFLADGACGDWRERLSIKVESLRIEMSGRFAAACGEKALGLVPLPSDQQVEGLFRALWQEIGGTWAGSVKSGTTPETATVLMTRRSAPLGEIVRDINKFSNNVMARHAFLALSPAVPATYELARERVTGWMKDKGIDPAGFSIENGSGLSRSDRISATQLRQVLAALWKGPVMPELVSSLPILGEDGTLRTRTNGNGRGRAHLKTGYIEGARALAGYVLDAKGRRWIFVAMINHANASKAKEAVDRLVEWTMRQGEEIATAAK